MTNRVLSLNQVSGFSIEELEPRMEMQMLGLGTEPGVVILYWAYIFLLVYTFYALVYI